MNLATFALASLAFLALSFSVSASVQDRMPPIPNDQMTEAQKKAAAELIAGPRGTVRCAARSSQKMGGTCATAVPSARN